MFRHILVATDGSRLSRPAIRRGVALAKALGARLTGVTVVAPYASASAGFSALPGYAAALRREARRALASFNAEARAQSVRATATMVEGGAPWRDILRVAHARGCDLVVVGSHGRGGVAGVVLGSETAKLLTRSRIPVLVCR